MLIVGLLLIYLILLNTGIGGINDDDDYFRSQTDHVYDRASIDIIDVTHHWQSILITDFYGVHISSGLPRININHSLPILPFYEVQTLLPSTLFLSFVDYHNQHNNFHPYMLFKVSISGTLNHDRISSWITTLLRNLQFHHDDDILLRLSFNINNIEYFEIKLKVIDNGIVNEEHIIQCNTRIDDSALKISLHIKSINESRTSAIFDRLLNKEFSSVDLNGETLVMMNESLHDYSKHSLLLITEMEVTYIPQPDKVDLSIHNTKRGLQIENATDNPMTTVVEPSSLSIDNSTTKPSSSTTDVTNSNKCSLLGVSHAVILNKIVINHSYALNYRQRHSLSSTIGIRLLCGIYTTAHNHDTKVKAQRETWGQKCSHFVVFSTTTDLSIPSIAIPHIGDESYENLWQKVRFIWKYIHHHYINDFDWFMLSGDDTYVVMENLVEYLTSTEMVAEKRKNAGTLGGGGVVVL